MKTDKTKKVFKKNLLRNAIQKFIGSMIIYGAILFIPAGTIYYWNAWLYIGTIVILMTIALMYLFKKDPILLEKRLRIKEKQKAQKRYIQLSVILLLGTFIIPGLDFRFKWSQLPSWIVFISLGIVIISYGMFVAVMIQNSYASRTIEIQKNQKLIDTGLYSLVRHPLYLSASVLYFASPLVLGSLYAVIPILLLPFLLAYRIINEEKLLMKSLKGYKAYAKRVKYRLIPYIW